MSLCAIIEVVSCWFLSIGGINETLAILTRFLNVNCSTNSPQNYLSLAKAGHYWYHQTTLYEESLMLLARNFESKLAEESVSSSLVMSVLYYNYHYC